MVETARILTSQHFCLDSVSFSQNYNLLIYLYFPAHNLTGQLYFFIGLRHYLAHRVQWVDYIFCLRLGVTLKLGSCIKWVSKNVLLMDYRVHTLTKDILPFINQL